MGAPKNPRLKSPSKVGSGPHPQKAPKQNYFSTLMQTPEGRELRRQWSLKKRKNAGRPKGTPDGLRKEQADTMRAEIKKEAAKSEVAVAKAEDFLASLITEEDDGPKASSGS